jgi:anaerobic selenocysteine-containing dehydrogenase
MNLTVGPTGGVDPESFVHSRYIVIWACNSISTNLHHWPFVLEAQKKGAKVVVIDSYRSRTAKQADWHIMPKPGTDGALATGHHRPDHSPGPRRQGLGGEAHSRLPRACRACGGVHA